MITNLRERMSLNHFCDCSEKLPAGAATGAAGAARQLTGTKNANTKNANT